MTMINILKYIFAVLIGMVIFANSANAGMRPTFFLDWASWKATDIAIVDDGKTIDGRLTVIESLQGSLKMGDVIVAPKLKKFHDKSWRTTGRSLRRGIVKLRYNQNTKPETMTGRRMLVFLQYPTKSTTPRILKYSDRITVEGRTGQFWIPASCGSTEASTVWLEKGKAYSFCQIKNPGPSVLIKLRLDEKEMLARIRKFVAGQDDLKRIDKMKNKSVAAKQAAAYINSKFIYLRQDALKVLGNCGQAALPILLQILADPQKSDIHSKVVGAMALIKGSNVDNKLTELFEQDVALWQKTGPKLKRGWWNGTGLSPKMNRRQLRNLYSRTLAYVYALKKRHVTQARKPLDRFHSFWRSLPQLDDPSGLNQMSQECALALKAIDKHISWWSKI